MNDWSSAVVFISAPLYLRSSWRFTNTIIIIIIIFFFLFFFTLGRCSRGRKKLVIKEKKNINTPMASDPGGSRQ